VWCGVSQCAAECCSMLLQCAAVCCSVLQCIAVCCSVLSARDKRGVGGEYYICAELLAFGQIQIQQVGCVLRYESECVAVCCSVML